MPSNYLILCHPLLLPSIFPRIRMFSNESTFPIRWPKCWSFNFCISPSNEYYNWFPLELTPCQLCQFRFKLCQFRGVFAHNLSLVPWDLKVASSLLPATHIPIRNGGVMKSLVNCLPGTKRKGRDVFAAECKRVRLFWSTPCGFILLLTSLPRLVDVNNIPCFTRCLLSTCMNQALSWGKWEINLLWDV